jgi:hypothetical protein
MADTLKVVVPTRFQAWERGAKSLARGFARRSFEWNLANEHFFGETQRFVHVVSGDLKRSGQERVELEHGSLVAIVEYGSDTVDYAQQELDRGGEHDFFALAWESSQSVFEAVFGESWLRTVASWR